MEESEKDQIRLLETLLEDPDLERLEDITQRFNILEVLDVVRQEVRHSNILAWLLNPRANHGLGDYFVRRFLWRTASLARDLGISSITPLDVDGLSLSEAVVRREWHGIDLLILVEAHRFVCAIENKVDSGEHSNQLSRYVAACEAEYPGFTHHFAFLTVSGDEPTHPRWIPVGYSSVIDILEHVLEYQRESVGDEVLTLLSHYDEALRRHIVRESTLDEICQRIYSKHQKALDLLFEYRPDQQAEIRQIVERLLSGHTGIVLDASSKTYIRFAHSSWAAPELSKGTGWTKSGRMLLFEFDNGADWLNLTLYIGPGDPMCGRRYLTPFAGSRGPARRRTFIRNGPPSGRSTSLALKTMSMTSIGSRHVWWTESLRLLQTTYRQLTTPSAPLNSADG